MKYFAHILAFVALIVPGLVFAQDQAPTFVPLTNIPALFEAGNASNINTPEGLSFFLNSIYRICIGAAAVIAVLQIMRAGIMYMGGDSVTEKSAAKNLIAMSIGGLILVLSPVIVFSIINPDILSLKINRIGELATQNSFSAKGLTEEGLRGATGTTEFCRNFDQIKTVKQKPDTPKSCEEGWVIIDRQGQCTGEGAPGTICNATLTGDYCCAHIAQTQYLLAYTYMKKTGSAPACRVDNIRPAYYAREAECKSALENLQKQPAPAGTTYSDFKILKACEKVTGLGYKIPTDPNSCSRPVGKAEAQ